MFPRYVIYYDTETKQEEISDTEIHQKFHFGYAEFVDYKGQSKRDSLEFTDRNVFWNWVVSKTVPNNKLYLFAHNQDFDFRIMEGFTHLQAKGWSIHKLIIDYPRFIVNFANYTKKKPSEKGNKNIEKSTPRKYITVLDSLNWFRESLAQLGKQVGLEKLSFPEKTATKEEWDEYCQRDVKILRLAMETYIQFLHDENLGNFGVTLASQSLTAFKHRFMEHEISIHTKEPAVELEREGYYGGRTECFRIGKYNKETFYKLDINSMYPHQMASQVYPVKLLAHRRFVQPDVWEHHYKKNLVLAKVIVHTNIPCVPLRMNDRLCFPIGTFTTTLCTPELRLLEESGQSFEVIRYNIYEAKEIFKSYVDTLYELRKSFVKQGNEQYQYFCKLLMNSLYGKFGQRNTSWTNEGDDGTFDTRMTTVIDAVKKETKTVKIINGEWFVEGEMLEAFDSFVAISAFVTSYSRACLWRFIVKAGIENVYYMDTDSLFTNKQGYENLKSEIHPTRLGALALEDTTDEMILHNLKDYVFGGEVKIKGVSRKGIKVAENKYQVEQWEHFNGAIRKDRMETVIVKKTFKTLKREYLKGHVDKDGVVTPFELNDSSYISM